MNIKVKYAVGDCVNFTNSHFINLTGEVKEIIVHIGKDSAKIIYKVDVMGKLWNVVSTFVKTEKG